MAGIDRAVRTFYKYARLGFDRRRFSPIEIASRVQGCSSCEGEALRLIAVYDMLRMLDALGKGDSSEAVRTVYFRNRGRSPRKNDISYAVRRFALSKSIDERTVWRRLEEAKTLYLMLLKGQNLCT